MNFTLNSLFLRNSYTLSPFFQTSNHHVNVHNSYFTNFFKSFLYSKTNFNFFNSEFNKFLNTPIVFTTEGQAPIIRTTYKITGKDANITHCKFSSCLNSQSAGGAISYKNEFYGTLSITRCAFAKCFSQQNGGAIFASCNIFDISQSCFHECSTTLGFGSTLFIQTNSSLSIFLTTFRKETKATRNTKHLNLLESKNNEIYLHNNNASQVIMKYGAVYSLQGSSSHQIGACVFCNSSVDSACYLDDIYTNISIIHSLFKHLQTKNHILDSTNKEITAFFIASCFKDIPSPSVSKANLSIIYYKSNIAKDAKNATYPGQFIDCTFSNDDIIKLHFVATHVCWDEDPAAFEIPKKYQSDRKSLGKKKLLILGIAGLISFIMIANVIFICYKCAMLIYKAVTAPAKKKKSEPAEMFIKEISRDPKQKDLQDIPTFSQVDDDAIDDDEV